VTTAAYLAAIEASGAREKLRATLVGLDADEDAPLTANLRVHHLVIPGRETRSAAP
jgi:hypothetical protein